MDENKYAYKSYKSIHTIYYIIPNNVIGGQAKKTYETRRNERNLT